MGNERKADAARWADIESSDVARLLEDTRSRGWEPALAIHEKSNPFFVKRLRDESLGNWHALLLKPREGRALDVGCGFGALLAGLASYYRTACGVEMLPERLRFAELRQVGTSRPRFPVVQGSGHSLPFRDRVMDLVTMNGVLEWAAYYVPGHPRACQLNMLRQARSLLSSRGTLAVAIENRYALENLVGLRDTHTGLHLLPALPRPIAGVASRLAGGKPYRTWLYSAAGYRALFREAGFSDIVVLDLIGSYNDYDFVVSLDDLASYRLLWARNWIKSFFPRTAAVRRTLAARAPQALGRLNYAYLVLGGERVETVLDSSHPLWTRLGEAGVTPAGSRFGCRLQSTGGMAVLTHNSGRLRHLVTLTPGGDAGSLPALTSEAASSALGAIGPGIVMDYEGVAIRTFSLT